MFWRPEYIPFSLAFTAASILWRPGTFEAFAWQFLGRVEADFAAAGDFAGGVVEYVGWAFGED